MAYKEMLYAVIVNIGYSIIYIGIVTHFGTIRSAKLVSLLSFGGKNLVRRCEGEEIGVEGFLHGLGFGDQDLFFDVGVYAQILFEGL